MANTERRVFASGFCCFIGVPLNRPKHVLEAGLLGVARDLDLMQTHCEMHECGIKFSNKSLWMVEATLSIVESAIQAFFHQENEADILLLHYSGHGGEQGWCLHDGNLSPERLFDMWERGTARRRGATLLLVLDSCHAGHWVAAAQQRSAEDVLVQAACLSDETTKDGLFTPVLVKYQDSRISWDEALRQLSVCGVHPIIYAPPALAGQRAIQIGEGTWRFIWADVPVPRPPPPPATPSDGPPLGSHDNPIPFEAFRSYFAELVTSQARRQLWHKVAPVLLLYPASEVSRSELEVMTVLRTYDKGNEYIESKRRLTPDKALIVNACTPDMEVYTKKLEDCKFLYLGDRDDEEAQPVLSSAELADRDQFEKWFRNHCGAMLRRRRSWEGGELGLGPGIRVQSYAKLAERLHTLANQYDRGELCWRLAFVRQKQSVAGMELTPEVWDTHARSLLTYAGSPRSADPAALRLFRLDPSGRTFKFEKSDVVVASFDGHQPAEVKQWHGQGTSNVWLADEHGHISTLSRRLFVYTIHTASFHATYLPRNSD